ncbi:transposase [Nonomuraea wenchangensis]
MTRRRRQFSPEFKEEAVRMVLEGDRTVASVARLRFQVAGALVLHSSVSAAPISASATSTSGRSWPSRAMTRSMAEA